MFTTFVPPVDATVISTRVDSFNRTQIVARCNVPEGAGQTLTVGLINDGGAEGVEFLGGHYPLTSSNVTELSVDVRLRRMALDSVAPISGPATGSTVISMRGKGFEEPMTCVFRRDSVPTTVGNVYTVEPG